MAGKRPDGDGLVRKRSDGRWEGRIIIGHKDDNSPIYKSVFAKTQKELMPKLHQAIEEYKGVDLTENSSMTVLIGFSLMFCTSDRVSPFCSNADTVSRVYSSVNLLPLYVSSILFAIIVPPRRLMQKP